MKKFLIFLFFFLILILGLGFYKFVSYSKPVNSKLAEEIEFIINKGDGVNAITAKLKSKDLIKSDIFFKLLIKYKKQESKIKAGEFLLSKSLTPEQVLEKITKPSHFFKSVLIKEGTSIFDLPLEIEKSGLFSKDEIDKLLKDEEIIKLANSPIDSIEGYLFPSTYYIASHETAKDLIIRMIKKLDKVYKRLAVDNKTGLNKHQILTLASIIEKEAANHIEKPKVSSVFHNRLRLGMKLQTDPTINYGFKSMSEPIYQSEINRKTDYNTYQLKGLPKGPICNVGESAIKAAFNPETTKYLYFVVNPKGGHSFTTNLKDHQKAVTVYRKSLK